MKKIILFVLVGIMSALSLTAQIYEPIKWKVEQKATSNTTADIIIKATIDKGWHLYGLNIPDDGPKATTIVFEKLENVKLNGGIKAQSKLVYEYDANFDMELNWYNKEAVFIQSVSFEAGKLPKAKGVIEYMACNDQTCLPPTLEYFQINIVTPATESDQLVDSLATNANAQTEETVEEPGTYTKYWTPVIDELKVFGENESTNSSLWWIFLLGFGGGLLALLTPCVWPIIPMTVSFFLKRSQGNNVRGRRDAILYGLAIILIYVTLGLLITLIFGASALNSLSTNAVFNVFLFALLVVFAISFFGAFEITLPSSWANKMDAKAESTAGFISILFMAFTLALVSFSCTGPIIGFLLVEVSSTGSILAPLMGMFGFAIALAIPFSLFAFFPSMLKSLPRSGGWLNTVKVVLAFIELAFALKFLSVADLAYGWGILDREVFIVLWVVIFALLGFYLLGKIRFPHDSESKHVSIPGVFLATISLSFALYLIPGLWGAPLKAVSAFLPPLSTQDFNLKEVDHLVFDDFDEGMRYAAKNNKSVFVDFTGYGCVNCRKMEAKVLANKKVQDAIEKDFIVITLFVDEKKELEQPFEIVENGRTRQIKTVGDKWSYLQRYKFGANAQPFYVLLDNEGKPMNKAYAYNENIQDFLDWLNVK